MNENINVAEMDPNFRGFLYRVSFDHENVPFVLSLKVIGYSTGSLGTPEYVCRRMDGQGDETVSQFQIGSSVFITFHAAYDDLQRLQKKIFGYAVKDHKFPDTYTYPAIFYVEDDGFLIDLPDFPRAPTEIVKNKDEAEPKAREVLEKELLEHELHGGWIPGPTALKDVEPYGPCWVRNITTGNMAPLREKILGSQD